jgi:hypothetical protein
VNTAYANKVAPPRIPASRPPSRDVPCLRSRVRPRPRPNPKRASAAKFGFECPRPRSAWAAPDHMRPGAANDENQPPSRVSGPWAYVITSGRPSEGEGANPSTTHETQPPLPLGRSAARRASPGASPPGSPSPAQTGSPAPSPGSAAPGSRARKISPGPGCPRRTGKPPKDEGWLGLVGGRGFAPSSSPGLPEGNHMGPGAADLRLGFLFAVCGPWAHVIRLRPGRPRMRTLKPPLCCASNAHHCCAGRTLAR